MSERALHELRVEERTDRVIVRILGEVDQSNVRDVEDELRGLDIKTLLVVDLSGALYFDSAGIAMMYALQQDTNLAVVAHPGSVVRRILEIAAFDQVVPMLPSADGPVPHL
jgi:anti-anti-sigma factor